MNKTLQPFPGFSEMERWIGIQKNHAEIIRFLPYADCNPNLLRQSNLAHISSTTSLFVHYCYLLNRYRNLDLGLLFAANTLHEDGEMLLKQDTIYDHKTESGDHEEFKAFYKSIGSNENDPRVKAFLLQFMHKKEQVMQWVHPAPRIMGLCLHDCEYEGKVFNALERIDYLFYAIGFGYLACKDVVILTHVLRNQVPALDQYAKDISGFEKVVWTPQLFNWAHRAISMYKDMPSPKIENKIQVGIPAAYEWAYRHGYMERPKKEELKMEEKAA